MTANNRDLVLAGTHVSLATMLADDQSFFHAWHTENEELRILIDDNTSPSMDDQLRWFERSKEPDRLLFSLVAEPDHVLIGHGGFVDIEPATHRAQFRITIGNSDFWGKGLGTEATQLIVQYGFASLDLTSIWLRVLQSNERAVRLYEKVGFAKTGEEGNSLIFEIHNSV